MKVFIVMMNIPYEGSDIEGIFISLEKAEKLRKELEQNKKLDGIYFDITEWEVEE